MVMFGMPACGEAALSVGAKEQTRTTKTTAALQSINTFLAILETNEGAGSIWDLSPDVLDYPARDTKRSHPESQPDIFTTCAHFFCVSAKSQIR
jgi:hypothetical protein